MEPPLLVDEFFDRSDREEEILRYIAGAMCYKFKLETKASSKHDSWIGIKGFGRLKEPSDEVFEKVKQFDNLFDLYQDSGLKSGFDPIGRCQKFIQSKYPDFNAKAILYFCRVKFFAKIRIMNKELQPKKYGAKNVRFYKQMAQFVN